MALLDAPLLLTIDAATARCLPQTLCLFKHVLQTPTHHFIFSTVRSNSTYNYYGGGSREADEAIGFRH